MGEIMAELNLALGNDALSPSQTMKLGVVEKHFCVLSEGITEKTATKCHRQPHKQTQDSAWMGCLLAGETGLSGRRVCGCVNPPCAVVPSKGRSLTPSDTQLANGKGHTAVEAEQHPLMTSLYQC